jgi:hypothetical protein
MIAEVWEHMMMVSLHVGDKRTGLQRDFFSGLGPLANFSGNLLFLLRIVLGDTLKSCIQALLIISWVYPKVRIFGN